MQSPFMLGVALERNNQGGYVDESWWTDADLKVMVFGQEPLNWPMPILDDGSQVQSDDFVELYQRFYSDNYKGEYFLTDSDNHLAKNKFFSMGFNGIMSGIKDFVLGEQYSDKKVAYLWNNISKLSVGGRNGVCKEIHELEKKYFHVIPQEIEITKPDVLIFLTGAKKLVPEGVEGRVAYKGLVEDTIFQLMECRASCSCCQLRLRALPR